MYYNIPLKRIILDPVDYLILTIILSIHLSEYFKSYFSEKQKMERLRQDLIHQSKLVKSFSQPRIPSSGRRVQKIVNFNIRGGSQELFYKNAEKIQKFVIYLLHILKKRIQNKKILNLLLFNAHLGLRLILLLWKINVSYYVDPVTKQTIIITMVCGGTTGFIISWMGVGATLFANCLVGVFLGRSLAQQLIHTLGYREFRNQAVNLIKGEEGPSKIAHIAQQSEDNKLKLNWDKNPAIKEAAERLGIFEEKPQLGGPIKSTDNRLYKRFLKKLGKTAEKVIDVEADLDIIDVDFVGENPPIKIPPIRIRD